MRPRIIVVLLVIWMAISYLQVCGAEERASVSADMRTAETVDAAHSQLFVKNAGGMFDIYVQAQDNSFYFEITKTADVRYDTIEIALIPDGDIMVDTTVSRDITITDGTVTGNIDDYLPEAKCRVALYGRTDIGNGSARLELLMTSKNYLVGRRTDPIFNSVEEALPYAESSILAYEDTRLLIKVPGTDTNLGFKTADKLDQKLREEKSGIVRFLLNPYNINFVAERNGSVYADISVECISNQKRIEQIRQLDAFAVQAVKKCSRKSVKKTIKAVNRYICKKAKYDYDAVMSYDYLAHNALGIPNTGKAVCDGYADLMELILTRLGIPCETVSNKNHAWNIIRVGKKWYHTDVTWNDASAGGRHTYYLMKGSKYMKKQGGHTIKMSKSFKKAHPIAKKNLKW